MNHEFHNVMKYCVVCEWFSAIYCSVPRKLGAYILASYPGSLSFLVVR